MPKKRLPKNVGGFFGSQNLKIHCGGIILVGCDVVGLGDIQIVSAAGNRDGVGG